MSKAPLDHIGAFASLCNAWTNSFRMEIELIEVKKIQERLDALENVRAYQEKKRKEGLIELKNGMRELKQLEKEIA